MSIYSVMQFCMSSFSTKKLDLELYSCLKELRFLEPRKINFKINKTNKQKNTHMHTEKKRNQAHNNRLCILMEDKNCRAINLRIFKDNMEIYFKKAQGKN